MTKSLPPRPNLDHLRRQAKTLLSQLEDGASSAARAFLDHLPEARRMSAARVRSAGFRLADAHSVIARQTGFASWPLLAKHVQQLRGLEGEWKFATLEIDATAMPAVAFGSSKLLIDGDRFRMESPEATYEGIFTIDVGDDPFRIDIEFVEGPEAGNWSYGIYMLEGDRFTLCLGLAGASRPVAFATKPGSGHALEHLERVSAARPAAMHGRKRSAAAAASTPAARPVDPSAFNVPMTPLLTRLEGTWAAVALVRDGQPMPNEWLGFGSRTAIGNEVKVVFGGQVMVHAKVRLDETTQPVSVDYFHLSGSQRGQVSLGILDWVGDDVRVLMASPGQNRPADFAGVGKGCTLSQWRRR